MPNSPVILQMSSNDVFVVTGANGFIGSRVVRELLNRGYRNVRCLVRPGSSANLRTQIGDVSGGQEVVFIEGNLLNRADCKALCEDARVIIHLAAGVDKSYSGSYLNTVVGTRNLLEEAASCDRFYRFVNISSFAVYSNWNIRRGGQLDEQCAVESSPSLRHEAYCYAKLHQERLVQEYANRRGVPCVILRPGAVYGPRSRQLLSPRVGIDTFGIFLHLGGRNRLPLTYVDNCAEAIAQAAIVPGINGEVINIVDDDLPRSKDFLRAFKKATGGPRSLHVPYAVFYWFSWLWEKYADWSNGQFGPVFNRRRCAAYWKGNQYSNAKAKRLLQWQPRVATAEGIEKHCAYFAQNAKNT
jgi:nucleoside-diphosphate-sugar epimerase